jgi:hypothetical protein
MSERYCIQRLCILSRPLLPIAADGLVLHTNSHAGKGVRSVWGGCHGVGGARPDLFFGPHGSLLKRSLDELEALDPV